MSSRAGTILRTERTQVGALDLALARAAGSIGFALLTWLGAWIRVPIPGTPVPVTLQTLAVLSAGGVLGARLGVCSQALYLGAGLAGLPVFAGPGSGWAYLTGPTAGYLAGFLPAAALVGWASGGRRRPGLGTLTLAACLGSVVVTLCGVLVLSLHLHGDVLAAAHQGAALFTPWDLAKAVAAAGAARVLRPARRFLDTCPEPGGWRSGRAGR